MGLHENLRRKCLKGLPLKYDQPPEQARRCCQPEPEHTRGGKGERTAQEHLQ